MKLSWLDTTESAARRDGATETSPGPGEGTPLRSAATGEEEDPADAGTTGRGVSTAQVILWIATAALWLVVWRLRARMQSFDARMDSIDAQVEQLRLDARMDSIDAQVEPLRRGPS